MKPIVVGIAGGTASGKTTAAHALAEALGERCLLLTHDRYYVSLPEGFRHDPVLFNFDHPDALETERLVHDLQRLRQGEAVRVPVYDFARHERLPPSAWDEVHPREIIVVEGILVLAEPALRSRMDHLVFVHAPDDVRLVRRMRRDMTARGRAPSEILDQYERTVRPMHERFVAPSQQHADLVLDGTSSPEAMVGAVLELIEPRPVERVASGGPR